VNVVIAAPVDGAGEEGSHRWMLLDKSCRLRRRQTDADRMDVQKVISRARQRRGVATICKFCICLQTVLRAQQRLNLRGIAAAVPSIYT
jgi:hypothetical protein